jgi:hypothetical protein
MTHKVPLVFRAWKEFVFERRANRIHEMLSSKDKDEEKSDAKEEEAYGEGDEDYEEYFYNGVGENEQYVKVVGDNDNDVMNIEKSTTILPLDSSNFYHDHNKYNR